MRKNSAKSDLERIFAEQIAAMGLPHPVTEFRFHTVRKWRLDFAWPDLMMAFEIEGGTHVGGRHTTGGGFEADIEKYNAAMMLGWNVYRATSSMVRNGRAINLLQKLLAHQKSSVKQL